jgi:hypothetical protein
MGNAVNQIVATLEPLTEQDKQLLKDYLIVHLQDVLDDARWSASFAQSPDTLDALAAEVDEAIARGDVQALDTDEL